MSPCQKYEYGVPQMKYGVLCLPLVKKSPTCKLCIKLQETENEREMMLYCLIKVGTLYQNS